AASFPTCRSRMANEWPSGMARLGLYWVQGSERCLGGWPAARLPPAEACHVTRLAPPSPTCQPSWQVGEGGDYHVCPANRCRCRSAVGDSPTRQLANSRRLSLAVISPFRFGPRFKAVARQPLRGAARLCARAQAG